MHLEDIVDTPYGIDRDGDVDMDRDGHNEEEADKEEDDAVEEDEDEDEDDGKDPWTFGQGGMVNTLADDVDTMVDD